MLERGEKFYTWLNRERPNTSLRPLQKMIIYAYFLITDENERTEVLDFIDEYEESHGPSSHNPASSRPTR